MPHIARKAELGQVWTPDKVAARMIERICIAMPRRKLSLLDPAVGPYTFPAAVMARKKAARIARFDMYDVDERMVRYSALRSKHVSKAWVATKADYLTTPTGARYDAVVMNPPYIRQERIRKSKKDRYYQLLQPFYAQRIDRRSNLFVLFLLKALQDLRPGGVLCAIVYDAIKSSRYGKVAMEAMAEYADLEYSEHVSAPFGDAIIDAQILCWRRLAKRRTIAQAGADHEDGLVELGSLMKVVRGAAIPLRKVFVSDGDSRFPGRVRLLVKQHDPSLFICRDFSNVIGDASAPAAKRHIARCARKLGVEWNGAFKLRTVPCQICFNYYVRDKPRHLLNRTKNSVSDNFYACTVKRNFPARAAWILLNSDQYLTAILGSGRNQGNGLTKIQAFEYRTARVPDWSKLSAGAVRRLTAGASLALRSRWSYEEFRSFATRLTAEAFDEQA